MAHRGLGHAREKHQYSTSAPGSGKWTRPTDHRILRSRGVLGVMLLDPGLSISYKIRIEREKDREKDRR